MQRSLFKTVAIASVVLLIAYMSFLLVVNSSKFQAWITAEIAARTDYEIAARDIRLDPLLRLTLADMTVSRAGQSLIQAERLLIVPSLAILFSRSIDRLELERPVLSLDLYESFAAAGREGSDVSIRQVLIRDGALVLTMGPGRRIDFRSVTMSAENVNLGGDIGLRLRAAIPSLDGIAVISVHGADNRTAVVARFDQNLDSLGDSAGKSRQTFDSKISMARAENGALRVTSDGKLDAMRFGGWSLTGGLAVSADIEPDETDNGLSATARLAVHDLLLRRPEQVEISAKAMRGEGKLQWNQNEPVTLSSSMQIEQGNFASADGTKLGEKLLLDARMASVQIDSGVSLAGKVNVRQGEVLWNKFYGDLKLHRPLLDFDLEYRPKQDRLRLRQASFGLAPLGTVTVNGDFTNLAKIPAAQIKIAGEGIQSAGIFQFFIRDTMNRSYPFLNRLAVTGQLKLAADMSGPVDKPSFEGAIDLHAGEVRAQSDDWRISGINLALPFRLGFPVSSEPLPGPARTGKLTVASAKIGAEVIPEIHAVISLWDNALRLHQPIRLPMYGGSLVISDLAWKDVAASPQAVSLSLAAANLQLRRLTEALGWYRFAGSLSGSIPKIEWTGESLRSEGQIDIAVFGGRLRMSLLEIANPFSPVPSIKLDAQLENIQLEQASETFAFGRISGVLAGTVNNLIMTAGQPSSFTADLHSVERSGVSQRISVESLNKITVLSSGRDAAGLYRGIAGLFDSFRYSKLGFKATLKNDKLTLRGVESRGGQEYLVVGSLIPPTVNVISHTQEIAFLELLRRLEQIQGSEPSQKSSS